MHIKPCPRYLKDRVDPFLWWKTNKTQQPLLAEIARDWLCVPAASRCSERLFSQIGNIITSKRQGWTLEQPNINPNINEKEASSKQAMAASTPKSAKRRKPSGQESQTQSQARDNEGSDVEFP